MDLEVSTQVFPSSSNGLFHTGRASVKFEIELQRLKEYKEMHGTVDVLLAHYGDERFEDLNKLFLTYQRDKINRLELGQAKTSSSACEARIRRLFDLGVDLTMDRVSEASEFKRNVTS
jgi:hypothetical protein